MDNSGSPIPSNFFSIVSTGGKPGIAMVNIGHPSIRLTGGTEFFASRALAIQRTL